MLWGIFLSTVAGLLCLFILIWFRMICFTKSFREQLVKGQLETTRQTLQALEGIEDTQSAIRLINQLSRHLRLTRCYARAEMDYYLMQHDSENFKKK